MHWYLVRRLRWRVPSRLVPLAQHLLLIMKVAAARKPVAVPAILVAQRAARHVVQPLAVRLAVRPLAARLVAQRHAVRLAARTNPVA